MRGDFPCSLPSPRFDGGVIAGEQKSGTFQPRKRAGCNGGSQEAGRERILSGAAFVAEHARDQAHDGIGDDESGQRSISKHVIADGNFVVDEVVGDALVDALVVARDENEMASRE